MAIGILARIIDVEADVAVVLHAAHVMPARDELGDPLDERGLSRIVPPTIDGTRYLYNSHAFLFVQESIPLRSPAENPLQEQRSVFSNTACRSVSKPLLR